ncbi:hypothetical protein [Phascolarctobacterium faecium]|uniref:hypothetical protein n=1 Tax=Phascolarctobacterium faecium TaxID=33025 RepID=UPI002666A02F|nr:hypothetical protein [Phascolarctobacterium faecium]
MEYLQTNIFMVISLLVQSGFLGVGWKVYSNYKKQVEERGKKTEALHNATRSLLRTEIIGIYHKSEEDGFIPLYNLENITDMYICYKALGGNGAITELYHKALQLPQKSPDTERGECGKCSRK